VSTVSSESLSFARWAASSRWAAPAALPTVAIRWLTSDGIFEAGAAAAASVVVTAEGWACAKTAHRIVMAKTAAAIGRVRA
jgi:hypothetical protein